MSHEPPGFREFVDARSGSLLRTAWMLTGDAVLAEDLLQSALAKTWRHWTRIESGRPEAYVRKVMVRLNSSWRARRWNAEVPGLQLDEARLTDGPDERTSQVDERIAITAALAALPPRQRQVVVLRFFDDLPVNEVAQIMGSSPGTVKSQSSKALAHLRRALDAVTSDPIENQPS